jgi:hypothetical protein
LKSTGIFSQKIRGKRNPAGICVPESAGIKKGKTVAKCGRVAYNKKRMLEFPTFSMKGRKE